MLLLVVVRPSVEKDIDRFAWGTLVIIVLGFGWGALIYQTRSWWIYLWHQYLRINNAGAILLEALFLLGVILGFFVVRNWAKEQKDFVSSLSAVLSGAFVASLLGKLQEGSPPAVTPMRAFAYYALGFTMSGSLNLIAAARLTANYVNKRSLTSRAVLDFLYGSERAKIIDGYFLKNFEDDKDYAKQRITETLIEFSKLAQREFAERLEKRRKLPEKATSCFYELVAVECEDQESTPKENGGAGAVEPIYNIIYKRIGSPPTALQIEGSMFRVGVSARWQDTLEYITAPGEYRAPFPYQGSVAGMALLFRQTIVMDRDINKRFRNKQYTDGICPKAIQQNRGLDIIDYLSYVAIPMVSSHGSPTENTLGVLTIDTKLFVAPQALAGKSVKGSEEIFSLHMTKSELSEYANNLYDHEDKDVEYVENLAKIITPILELYSKCRVGAT